VSRPPRIMLSAGEASGDRLGAGLAHALRQRRPQIELFGMGGAEMARAGVEIVQDSSEVAVMGFLEVVSHLPALRAAKRRLLNCLDTRHPDLLVPIDFPDFNFILSSNARRRGVPVVYFVSPQIWAWRRGRVQKIRRMVRRILVLFPFEVPFYTEAGVPVSFVGHPVVERVPSSRSPEDLRREIGFDPTTTVVALLPGSRRGEIDHLLPVLLEAAASCSPCCSRPRPCCAKHTPRSVSWCPWPPDFPARSSSGSFTLPGWPGAGSTKAISRIFCERVPPVRSPPGRRAWRPRSSVFRWSWSTG